MNFMRIGLLLGVGFVTPGFVGLDGLVGNDTGGIIPWSPDIRHDYRAIAADHCARYNKDARITSVHARYGDYVGFKCFFPRGYDPVKDAYRRSYSGDVISTLD